jgi:peptide/nickel transport system substrate-binding protein
METRDAVRSAMQAQALDALVAGAPEHVFYLSGARLLMQRLVPNRFAFALLTTRTSILLTVRLDADHARLDSTVDMVIDTHDLIMNQAKPPFHTREARLGVRYAVNRPDIAKVVFSGNVTLRAGPVPGVLGYDPALARRCGCDPSQARSLVRESGAGDVPVVVLHVTEGFWPEEARLLQAAGFKVSLQGFDQAALFAKINAVEQQMYLNEWVMDTGDPDDVMYGVFLARRRKRTGYASAEVDALNAQAQIERDPNKRRALYVEGQRRVLDDGPFVAPGYPKTAWGATAAVNGLNVGPLGDVAIRGVTLA